MLTGYAVRLHMALCDLCGGDTTDTPPGGNQPTNSCNLAAIPGSGTIYRGAWWRGVRGAGQEVPSAGCLALGDALQALAMLLVERVAEVDAVDEVEAAVARATAE